MPFSRAFMLSEHKQPKCKGDLLILFPVMITTLHLHISTYRVAQKYIRSYHIGYLFKNLSLFQALKRNCLISQMLKMSSFNIATFFKSLQDTLTHSAAQIPIFMNFSNKLSCLKVEKCEKLLATLDVPSRHFQTIQYCFNIHFLCS